MASLNDILELYRGTDEQGEFLSDDSSVSLCEDWDCDCHGDCDSDCSSW